ncbi:SHSA1 protein, partial [Eulacestoma nigropectus]|nr:SHSA1 protein [Eulacestoma nigropectus]
MAVGRALALLLALGCARAGEFCHGWAGGARRWHRGFQCPERWDGPAATLCCGSCALRYCCASPAARLDQGHCPGALPTPGPPAPVPGYLPFLLVGSVFVAFVVGGACVGICCCKHFKSRAEGQPGGLAAGQTWLLEADAPCPLPGSGGSGARRALAPSPPVPGLAADPRFLTPTRSSAQLSHPSRGHHGIPTDHTALGARLFLQRPPHGHRASAAPAGVAAAEPALFPAVPV